MGRRAIHLTESAKAAAKREQVKKYSQTPHGQLTRANARKPERRRKGGKHTAESPAKYPLSISGLPTLSADIQEWYNAPLPDHEPLFQEALRSPDALDESDLARWKKEPPFVEDEDSTDPYSNEYFAFTKSLVTVLHGVRLREQKTRDARRRVEFLEKGWKAAVAELREEVRSLLARWEIVTRLSREQHYHPYHASREHAMLEHYLQWLARTIYSLYYLQFLE
ncbi:hypothetical protein C8R45DRAFT_1105272 [Mycena sanguinolenta]|nr:hypothetical protein C8R45DRAFT_1105272 [Mycena sanguinolenta]